jgi:colanic acid/amylovoran biosynthesis glycosyltransferase
MRPYHLRIGIVVDSFPTISETFILNQIIDLKNLGHEVSILTFHCDKSGIAYEQVREHYLDKMIQKFVFPPQGLLKRIALVNQIIWRNLLHLNFKELIVSLSPIRHGKQALNFSTFFEAQWFILNSRFDIIHAHFGHNGAFIGNLKKLGFLKNTKLITTFHGYDISPNQIPLWEEKYKELFMQSSFVTVNSQYSEDIIRKINQRALVKRLPVGVDTEFFKPKQKDSSSTFRILFCGRLISLKGPHLAIEIMKQLINEDKIENIILNIVGGGDLLNELENQVSTNRLIDYVLFHNKTSHTEVKELMQQSDLLVLPGITDKSTGRAETQGLVIQEAQAMEIPVLVSSAGGMKYGLIDNITGFVVEEGDINGFCKRIIQLKDDKELRIQMGKKGRAYVKENFERRILLEDLLDEYNKILVK